VLAVRDYWAMTKQAAQAWNDDYATSMGAAIAYYTTFSLTPLLIIVIAVAGVVFGQEAARGEIVYQLRGLVGEPGAKAVEELLQSASQPDTSVIASLIGIVTLFIGATSVFAELQSALDRIWRAPAIHQPAGVLLILRSRLLSFGMVIAMGFLLLVSLVFGAALTALGKWGETIFPGWLAALEWVNVGIGFGVTTALFALAYRVLPRARIAWADVWVGAVVTAVLFTVGKYLIGLYIGQAGVSSGFGAAGSLIIILVWVYYSAQIFLLGAEFTWVYAHSHGSKAGVAPPPPRALGSACRSLVPPSCGVARRASRRA
jgi:membrane protein